MCPSQTLKSSRTLPFDSIQADSESGDKADWNMLDRQIRAASGDDDDLRLLKKVYNQVAIRGEIHEELDCLH